MDRLAFIIEQAEEWRRRDPELLDRRGFIKHLNESEYYNYPIRDM